MKSVSSISDVVQPEVSGQSCAGRPWRRAGAAEPSGFRVSPWAGSSGIGPREGRGPSLEEGGGSGGGGGGRSPSLPLSRPCAFSVLRSGPAPFPCDGRLQPGGASGLPANGMGNRGAARMRDFSFWIPSTVLPRSESEGQGSDFVKCRNDRDLSSALHAPGRAGSPNRRPSAHPACSPARSRL